MPADIFTLTSELHEAIAQRVHLEDLLNFSATCKQFQRTVTESSEVWEHLYSVHFKDSAYSRDVEARVAFKARWMLDAHKTKHRRQLRLLRVHSALKSKQRERSHAQHALRRARESIERLEMERAGLLQARTLGAATQCWQPAVVRNHHMQMLASTPIQCEARLQDVDMALRDHRLAIRSSIKQINANDSQIQSLQSELKALHSRHFAAALDSGRNHQASSHLS